MKKLLALLIATGSLFMVSCSDDNGPSIEITAPADGTNYSAGDSITVQGLATDDMEVTSITFEGSEGFNLSGSLDLSGVTDRSSIQFTTNVILDAAVAAGDYSITVIATDNDNNTDEDSFDFSVQ